MATALEFLKERLRDVGGLMAIALEFLKEELLQGLKESIAEFHWEKLSNLHQVLLNKTKKLGEALWKAAVDFLVQKMEALLPPGTSSDTVRFWVQLVMPLLLFLSLHYFFCAAYRAIKMIKAVARAVWETIIGDGRKMMRAPGRPGHRIPRAGFEADPGSYFRGLHANAPRQGASSKSKWFTVGVGVVTAGVVLLKLL